MQDRQKALADIIHLMEHHHITTKDIEQGAINAPQNEFTTRIKLFFGYIGGIFLFLGICFFAIQQWPNINSFGKVIITLGSGICFFILGLISTKNNKWSGIQTPMFVIASALEFIGLFVVLAEYFPNLLSPNYPALVILGAIFLQQWFAFLKTKKTTLLFLSIIFASAFIARGLDLLQFRLEEIAIIGGGIWMYLAFKLHNTEHTNLAAPLYFISSLSLLLGTYFEVDSTPLEVIFPGLCTFIIYLSTVVGSRSLLIVGTLGLIAYICYYTEKYFLDSFGWPLTLICIGVIMFVLSSIAVKIGKNLK